MVTSLKADAERECPQLPATRSDVGKGRPAAYALLALGALGAGVLGAAFDQLTVTLSPEYFLLGKGVGGDLDLRAAAAWVGFRGGLPLGALVVGVGLWVDGAGAAVGWRQHLLGTLATAGVGAVVAAPLLWFVDPFDVRAASAGVMSEAQASRYLLAWGAHGGLYAGVVAAALARAAGRRRERT